MKQDYVHIFLLLIDVLVRTLEEEPCSFGGVRVNFTSGIHLLSQCSMKKVLKKRRKHCALAVVRRRQKIAPPQTLHGDAG